MSRKFMELPEETRLERISALRGFDKAIYGYAKTLAATAGFSIKPPPPRKTVKSIDLVYQYLKSVNARDFESGKGSREIAKQLGLSTSMVSQCLSRLVEKGLVKSEQRGRRIRYYLP